MTDNMKILIDQVTTAINSEYGDSLPTLEQINDKADTFRSLFAPLYPISDEEYIRVKRELATNILHRIGVATTLRGHDAEHQSWYFIQENDGYYWNRYKTYLKNVKHWGIDVVNRLNQTTDEIMDDLGNPKRIYDAVRINTELLNIKNEMAEIGPRSGIEKQLDSLKKQKDTQSKELSISEEDISKYDTAISELTKLKAQLQIIDNDISIINSIDSVVVPVEPDDALSDDAQKDYSDAISTIKNKADELWKEYKLAIIKKCQANRGKVATEAENRTTVADSLKDKVESNEAIAELSKRIQEEEQKLLVFSDYEKRIDEKNLELNGIISDLVQAFTKYNGIQKRYATIVNDEGNNINKDGELTFSVLIPFRTEAFCQRIKQLFDNRTLKSKKDIIDVENFDIDQFDENALEKLGRI